MKTRPKNEDGNNAENEDKIEHEDLDEDENENEGKRRPQIITTQRTPTPCQTPWKNNMAHKHKQTFSPGNEKVTFPRSYAYTQKSTANVRKSCTPMLWYIP